MTTQHELIDAAIKKVGNRYIATMLVAKRIRQLHHGAPSYVERAEGESPFTVAMREVAEGRVTVNTLVQADTATTDTTADSDNDTADEVPLPEHTAEETSQA